MKNKKNYWVVLFMMLGLVFLNQIVIQYFLYNKKNDSNLINLGGRQRMLSQNINQLSYRNIVSDENNYGKLTAKLNQWKTAQIALINGSEELKISKITNKETLTKLANGLVLINRLDSVIQLRDLNEASLTFINKNVDAFLPLMENIVTDLQKISDKKLSKIIMLEIILALVTIIVVFIEFQLIIKPSYNRILKQNKTLREIAWKQAHEVRKPIVTIIGVSKMIQENQTLTPEDKNKCLDYLIEATEELDKVVIEIINKTE